MNSILGQLSPLDYYYRRLPNNNNYSLLFQTIINWNSGFFFLLVRFHSNVQNATSFHHMARMMDSLILNDFPPYTFTKITTTHRPTRTSNGISSTSKLLTKSTANISTASSNLNNNNNNNNNGVNVASVLGLNNNGLRQNSLQKTNNVPTQGRHKFIYHLINENVIHFFFFFCLFP